MRKHYPDPTADIAIANADKAAKKMKGKLKNRIPFDKTTVGGATMKLIYISHPYSGDERKNRTDAEKIAAGLQKRYPHIVFVNPLNAMRHIKKTKLTYDDTLALCIGLLAACDGIIMTGSWKDSKGCNMERSFAISREMPVWDDESSFRDREVMPNDCCGKYVDCKTCDCRTCSKRLACWNCNDCTEVAGKNPIGFTGPNVYACSRYRKAR